MPTTPIRADWPKYVDEIVGKRKKREDEEFAQAYKKQQYKISRERNPSRRSLRSDAKFGTLGL